MKTLNELMEGYTHRLQEGEIQIAYKAIFEFLGKLRADFIKKYPHYDVSGIYQGYMDMSYFSLTTKLLKDKGLKIAVVYLHEKGRFEVWLSGRNRDIAKKYEAILSGEGQKALFHDETNPDAVVECVLSCSPNFENQVLLTDIINQGVEKFVSGITSRL